jgi:hypothetical protein
LTAFADDSAYTKLKYFIGILSSFGIFYAVASDMAAFYRMYYDPKLPLIWTEFYLAVVLLRWLLDLVDLFYAREVVYKRDDMSAMMLDSISAKTFRVRSLKHFVLYQRAWASVSVRDGIIIWVLAGLQNAKRLALVSIPQTFIMGAALYFKNNQTLEEGELPDTKTITIYIINLLTLFVDMSRLIHLIMLYPCFRCCLCGAIDQSMSLWDLMNLKMETVLNKMLQDDPSSASELYSIEQKNLQNPSNDSFK